MQPFIELPKVILNNEQQQKEVITRVQPGEIADYYPGFHEGTVIVLKSGSSFFVPLPIEQVDAIIAAYAEFVRTNQGKFGNLKFKTKSKLHAAN